MPYLQSRPGPTGRGPIRPIRRPTIRRRTTAGRRARWSTGMMLRPGHRGRRRLVRRLELGRRWGGGGVGRLARLGPRQQLHHRQRQPRDQHQPNNFNATTTPTAAGTTIRRIATACPIATAAAASATTRTGPMPPSASSSAADCQTAPAATAATRGAETGTDGRAARTAIAATRPARRIAGNDWRGSETTAASTASAFDGVDRGQQVASRGTTAAVRAAAIAADRGGGGGGRGGGGHGGRR